MPKPVVSTWHRRWVFEVAYGVMVLAAVSLILSIVGRRSGWPIGQAFNNELILVQLYAAHFRHLDLFPVWSSSDALGLGTPVLLFYQKAFFYVSGLLLILFGGAMKPALVVTVGLYLAVGVYGMRRALALVTQSRLLLTVGSIGFLFTNYVFTDWLVRGDLPEFSAMMLVPWLLYWCLELVMNRRVSLVLIPVIPLLVDAHSAIGLLSVITLLVAAGTFLAVAGLAGLRSIAPRLVVVAAGCAVLLAPTLLAELRFARYYDPASKVTHHNTVSQEFVDFWSYFYNSSYHWLVNTAHLNLQIDFSLWIPVLATVVAALVYRIARRPRDRGVPFWGHLDTAPRAFLLVSLMIYLLLQWRLFLGVYRFVAPLEVIDYPYRMLAFIVPILVVVVVAIADGLRRNHPHGLLLPVVAVAWLLSLVLLSPVTSTWKTTYGLLAATGQFPSASVAAPPPFVDYRTYRGFFSFNGILYDEYLPKVLTVQGHELYDDGPLYTELHHRSDGAASLSRTRCTVTVPTKTPLESLQLRFGVDCDGPTRLALPVTYNPFSTVFTVDAAGRLHPIPYFHSPTDPRIIIAVARPGPEKIVVHLPTLWGVLS